VIIDTSAWIEFSRSASGPVRAAIDAALDSKQAMTTDIVRLELLVGLSVPARAAMAGILAGCRFLPQEGYFDVEDAVDLFDRCRRGGETIRSPNDCLIAAIAIRHEVPVLHRDRDFDTLSRHTGLAAVRA
jgi:hypothetical protein